MLLVYEFDFPHYRKDLSVVWRKSLWSLHQPITGVNISSRWRSDYLQLVHSGAREMFGIFFNEPRRRSIAVQVYGKVIQCNPVYGISLAVASTDREIHLCKPYHTTSEYICHNICQCPEGKGCSHVIIMVSPMMALLDRAPQICEINLEGWVQITGPIAI